MACLPEGRFGRIGQDRARHLHNANASNYNCNAQDDGGPETSLQPKRLDEAYEGDDKQLGDLVVVVACGGV